VLSGSQSGREKRRKSRKAEGPRRFCTCTPPVVRHVRLAGACLSGHVDARRPYSAALGRSSPVEDLHKKLNTPARCGPRPAACAYVVQRQNRWRRSRARPKDQYPRWLRKAPLSGPPCHRSPPRTRMRPIGQEYSKHEKSPRRGQCSAVARGPSCQAIEKVLGSSK